MRKKRSVVWYLRFIIPVFLVLTLPAVILLLQQSTFFAPKADSNANLVPFYQLSKGTLNLYTADSNEKTQAISTYGFAEVLPALGKLFSSAQPETVALYRFNTGSGYFFTGSEDEAKSVAAYGWKKEGIAGYVYQVAKPSTIALYRFRKDAQWALATDQVGAKSLTDQGFTKDGAIGYFYPVDYILAVASPTVIAPTQRPNPTSSPVTSVSKSKTQIGAFFFYWFDCPSTSYQCDTTKMPFQPSDYQHYSAANLDWYKTEFAAMAKAGVDIIIPVSWGSRHPSLTTLRDSQSVPLMVQALQANQSKQKIAMLDDTNSVVAEWNVDQGRAYSNPTENPEIPKMPLSNDKNWSYFYDRKIKAFYSTVPKKYWATHNGASIEQGGRPVVLIYDGVRSFSNLESSDEMWFAIKNAFKKDFQVEPFIILDYSWFDFNSQKAELEKVVDGKFVWAGGNDTVAKKYTLKGYTTASVDPGFVCPSWSIYAGCNTKDRHTDPFTGKKGDGERLRATFAKAMGSDLILVETWNELNEGSGISASSQYKSRLGLPMRTTYYQDLLSSLKRQYIQNK